MRARADVIYDLHAVTQWRLSLLISPAEPPEVQHQCLLRLQLL